MNQQEPNNAGQYVEFYISYDFYLHCSESLNSVSSETADLTRD